MRSLILLFISLITISLNAQDYTCDLKGIDKVVITSEAPIRLKIHQVREFLIKEAENEDHLVPEKARGLKSVTQDGTDNTNFGVEVNRIENKLVVKCLLDERSKDLVIRLPKDLNVSIEVMDLMDIYVDGFSSEIEAINSRGDIVLTNITGPIVVENDRGNVIVEFSEVNQGLPSSIVVARGEIDIKMPANSKVNFRSKTPVGDFYTDFDFTSSTGIGSRYRELGVSGTINNGGVFMDLQNLKGDIYLRKLE